VLSIVSHVSLSVDSRILTLVFGWFSDFEWALDGRKEREDEENQEGLPALVS